jgi:hypothetical protein
MQPDCILHEEKLNQLTADMAVIAQHLTVLLERSNDFTVKVINGKTEERLASELLGELYVAMKEVQKSTPKNLWNNFGTVILPVLNLLTIVGLLIAIFH